jgi:cephalosporin-C deacetylase
VTVTTNADGSFTATCPNYTAQVGADGNLHSLVSGGSEFLLDGPRGLVGAGYQTLTEGDWKSVPFKFDKTELTAPDTVTATADKHKLTFKFVADEIELGFSHLAPPTIYYFILNPAIKNLQERNSGESVPYRSIPRDGVIAAYNASGANVTFPTGDLYYIARNSAQKLDTDPMVMMDWMGQTWGTQVVTQKITVHASPTLADALQAYLNVTPANFVFPGGAAPTVPLKLHMCFPNLPLDSRLQFTATEFLTKKVVTQTEQPLQLPALGEGEVTFSPPAQPGFYTGVITVKQGDEILATRQFPYAYDIAHLTLPDRPADFDKFWDDTLAEQAKIDPDWQLVVEKQTPAYTLYRTTFTGLAGRKFHAWLSVPTKPGKYPAQLTMMPSGINVAYLPAVGPAVVGMTLAIAGQELTIPAGMTSFPPDPYLRQGTDYWRTGIETRETWYYRIAFAACSRCVDLLASRPEVDVSKISVGGGSQGGGLSFITAALNPKVSMAVCGSSGLFGLEWKLRYLPANWWPPIDPVNDKNEPITDPAALEQRISVVRYGDAANFAPRIHCAVLLCVGLEDHTTCQMATLASWSRLNHASYRALLADPWGGHNGPRGGQWLGSAWNQALAAGNLDQLLTYTQADVLPVVVEKGP